MADINERFTWATGVMKMAADDRILEIGCGAGILVEQMANTITTGRITAIDKSAAMIKMAAKRNSRFVESGKVSFVAREFSEITFIHYSFNKIIAFNVNFFRKEPEQELTIIKKILRPGGLLYVFYQAPFDIDSSAGEPIKEKLVAHSFEIVQTVFKKMKPASALCIVAKPGIP